MPPLNPGRFTHPVTGWFLRAGGHIPVVPGAASRGPLLMAEQALRAGELVLVYPEGGIASASGAAAGKGGAGLLVVRAHVPVIPLRSRGLERDRVVGWRPWRRLDAWVSVGAPVQLPDVGHLRGAARYQALGDTLLAAVQRL